jgi:hypothetical protein
VKSSVNFKENKMGVTELDVEEIVLKDIPVFFYMAVQINKIHLKGYFKNILVLL